MIDQKLLKGRYWLPLWPLSRVLLSFDVSNLAFKENKIARASCSHAVTPPKLVLGFGLMNKTCRQPEVTI